MYGRSGGTGSLNEIAGYNDDGIFMGLSWNNTTDDQLSTDVFFRDDFVVTAPGVAPGSPLDTAFEVLAQGFSIRSLTPGSVVTAGLIVHVENGPDLLLNASDVATATSADTGRVDLVPGLAPIEVIAGMPVEMTVELTATIGCHPSCGGSGFYEIYGMDTAKITDIEVLDPITHQEVPGATVTSSSGTIYPVDQAPEPTTLMFCAGGLGALVARRLVFNGRTL